MLEASRTFAALDSLLSSLNILRDSSDNNRERSYNHSMQYLHGLIDDQRWIDILNAAAWPNLVPVG